MKKLTLFIAVFLVGFVAKSQDLKQLMKSGDSLMNLKVYDKAAILYKKLVDDVIQGKIKADDRQWRVILYNAGWSGSRSGELQTIIKYNNMYYGSRGEKLSEKIDFLNAIDIKFMFIYSSYFNGGSRSIVIDGCTSNERRNLIWYAAKKWYVQAFDECHTYKPIAFENDELYRLVSISMAQILEEKITDLDINDSHSTKYQFEFYPSSGKVSKEFDEADITVYKEGNLRLKRLNERKNLPAYQENLSKKLILLQKLSEDLSVKYRDTLSSISERQKVGKI